MSAAPLKGLRVVDFTRVLAGSHCTKVLRDLGADITTIEPPGGDVARNGAPHIDGMSLYQTQQNAGKRNLSIDLNWPEAREILAGLGQEADVIVENFRPGTLARFGLGYEQVKVRNPGRRLRLDQRLPPDRRVEEPARLRADGARRDRVHRHRRPHHGDALEGLHNDACSHADVYKLMNCLIVPRPIAWTTTIDEHGVVNLAPYSTFNIVCTDPPLPGMNVGFREDGTRKDTSANARANGELVIHIADVSMLVQLHASSFPYAPGVSEAERLGMALAPSLDVRVPRLRDAPLTLECRIHQVISFSHKADFQVSRIVRVHAREGLLSDSKIDTSALDPLSRLGGPVYGRLGETVTVKPPVAR